MFGKATLESVNTEVEGNYEGIWSKYVKADDFKGIEAQYGKDWVASLKGARCFIGSCLDSGMFGTWCDKRVANGEPWHEKAKWAIIEKAQDAVTKAIAERKKVPTNRWAKIKLDTALHDAQEDIKHVIQAMVSNQYQRYVTDGKCKDATITVGAYTWTLKSQSKTAMTVTEKVDSTKLFKPVS